MSQLSFREPARVPTVSVTDHPADHCLEAYCRGCHNVVDAVCPKCKGNVEPAGHTTVDGPGLSSLPHPEFYRRFVTLIQATRNSKFMLCCYLIATGDAYADGVSMAEVAKAWGVGRAAVSKQCRDICAHLGIQPSTYMRKEEAAARSRISNRRPVKHE